MKKFSVFLLVIICSLSLNSQSLNVFTKDGAKSQFALSQVDSITFSTSSSLNYTTVFVDSFSTNLSAWTQYNGGTWQITNGILYANYDISCGSVGCPQSQLLLNDQYQVTGNFRASIQFTRAIDSNYPTYSQASPEFCIWSSSSSRFQISIGGGGDTWGTIQQDSISIVIQEWQGQWMNSRFKTIGFKWLPTQWHTATIERIGNIYNCYCDGVYLGPLIDTYLNGAGKIGLHTYGPQKLDNFKLEKPN